MTKFKFNNWFTCEVENAQSMREWVPTNAQTEEGAKRAAKRRQAFEGTTIKTGMWSGRSGDIKTMSINAGRDWVKAAGQHLEITT